MESHLNAVGLPHRRVKGLSFDEIFLPTDVVTGWETVHAKVHTSEKIPSRTDRSFLSLHGNVSHIVVGLVGRSKTNKIKEVGCTSSHLEAIRQAIYENRTNSKYAIITEDDIFIPFNIDFQKLVASAPPDFSILQLFNSNGDSMRHSFDRYRKHGELWIEHRTRAFLAFWSTCAYLINREALKPIIDKIIYPDNEGRYRMKIIAGVPGPCRPLDSECCKPNGQNGYTFVLQSPCIVAYKGFQADSFIYALNKTYVLNIPLITNGAGGNQSTFHQDHVELLHQTSFLKQRGYINDLIQSKVQLPDFATPACASVAVEMKLSRSKSCSYTDTYKWKNNSQILWISHTDRLLAMSNMQHYLSAVVPWRNTRIFGIRETNLFIPTDLASNWDTIHCKGLTDQLRLDDTTRQDELVRNGFQGAVVGLCGRGRHNQQNARELSLTTSHLWAIYHGYTFRSTSSKYVVIIEDDIIFPFNIDFDHLADLAPRDFLFLRLFASEDKALQSGWERYTRNHSDLFTRYQHYDRYHHDNVNDKYRDELSVKAYIVNLEMAGDVLKKVVPEVHWYNKGEKLFPMFSIIAGMDRPCFPTGCCKGKSFIQELPCVLSKAGHHADEYLWHLGPTYSLNLPILTSAFGDQRNTLHPKKKLVFDERIRQQRRLINSLISGQVPLPEFARFGCDEPLSLV